MQKNVYFRQVLRRENRVQRFFFDAFLMFASIPRLLLEVFVRKDFGPRYFRIGPVLTALGLLTAMPWFFSLPIFRGDFGDRDMDDERYDMAQHSSSISPYLSWYFFMLAFLGFCIKHYIERRRNHPGYDFNTYSLDGGKLSLPLDKIRMNGTNINERMIRTILEPALFLIPGFFLWLVNQHLGMLLMVCSIFYSGSYFAAYKIGDDFIWDKIDEMICNEGLKKTFVDGKNEETGGFRYPGPVPEDANIRQQIFPLMNEEIPEAG